MGNTLIKTLGTVWAIIGLILMVAGLIIYQYEDAETILNADTGEKSYAVGLALLFLAVIVYLVGLLLKPSIGDILRAERLVEENKDKLRAYREGPDTNTGENYWRD